MPFMHLIQYQYRITDTYDDTSIFYIMKHRWLQDKGHDDMFYFNNKLMLILQATTVGQIQSIVTNYDIKTHGYKFTPDTRYPVKQGSSGQCLGRSRTAPTVHSIAVCTSTTDEVRHGDSTVHSNIYVQQ